MWKLLLLQGSLAWLARVVPADTGACENQYCIIETLQRQMNGMQDFFHAMVDEFRRLQTASDYQNIIQYGSGVSRIRSSGVTAHHPFMEAGVADMQSVLNIHDHCEWELLMGMGEFSAFMGGVPLVTRHNDYRMMKKSTTTKGYTELEDVDTPGVPPSVASKATVAEQIAEMKEYFRAFKHQDPSIRADYETYFKPALIYMETAWFDFDQDSITESFDSARHHLNARSWRELFQRADFNIHTGYKDPKENVAYLPARLYGMDENNRPKVAQYIYRILAHEIKRKFKTDFLEVRDDTGIKVKLTKQYGPSALESIAEKRQCRFQVIRQSMEPENQMGRNMTILDQIFLEIPGMSNLGNCVDSLEGETAYQARNDDELRELNLCRYHRMYTTADATANGNKHVTKGFNDGYSYMAMNREEAIVPSWFEHCNYNGDVCTRYEQRWSYATPLEIVWLTPLMKWNPYDIAHQGEHKTTHGDRIYDGCGDNRCNGKTAATAFNGCNSANFYFTPAELFTSGVEADPADTTPPNGVWVRDKNGIAHKMQASGIRIQYSMGDELEKVRGRYPIFEAAEEKTFTFMQMKALEDIVQQPRENWHLVNYTGTPWDTAGLS